MSPSVARPSVHRPHARRNLIADFELKDAPSFLETKVIAQFCMEKFLNGDVDKVSVLFTHFINTINQKPVVRTLLPISSFELSAAAGGERDSAEAAPIR